MSGLGLVQAGVAALQPAAGSLMAAVWQGILLASVVWIGLRLLPKTPAAVRFAIWFAVFVVMAALPMIALWPHAGGAATRAGGRGPWLTLDARWCVAIGAIWALASVWRVGQLVVGALRVRALWQRATPVEVDAGILKTTADPSTPQVASATCSAQDDSSDFGVTPIGSPSSARDDSSNLISTSRRAQVCTSDEVDRPTVIGFFAPKILIPHWLLEKLTPTELEQVVLHECGHLGRADDWMNLVQKIALAVFPLNPALAWVERRLCFERELACDERVLRATGAPKAYAACLATLAEHRLGHRGLALALGALGRESELGQRVRRILLRGERMKPVHAKLVLGGAMLGLLVAATGLEHAPQLVGFAKTDSGVVAHGDQGLPTHGDETAMNGAPGGIGYQPVMMRMGATGMGTWRTVGDAAPATGKQPSNSTITSKSKVNHEIAAARVEAVKERKIARNASTRMIRTATADSQPTAGGDMVVTQWTVVTSWRGEDGSRMVMTSSRVLQGAPSSEQDVQATEPQEIHPYAAVPVRGGWLVFQL